MNHSHHDPRRHGRRAILLACAAILASCGKSTVDETSLEVRVSSTLPAGGLDDVRVVVRSTATSTRTYEFPLVSQGGGKSFTLPLSLAFTPNGDLASSFGIDVSGWLKGAAVVVRSFTIDGFSKGQARLLDVVLTVDCESCASGQPCAVPACAPMELAPASLPLAATPDAGSPDAGAERRDATGAAGAAGGAGTTDGASAAGGGAAGRAVDAGGAAGTPDAAPDATPECAVGASRSCAQDHMLGACAKGTEACQGGHWGACSVQPTVLDDCAVLGDDSNCDGYPNTNCLCVQGQTQPCGPSVAVGICKPGIETCQNEQWSKCNAVFAMPRDCTSSNDNDCDGVKDDVIDTTCTCVPDATLPCTLHPDNDGKGPCHGGVLTCTLGPGKTESSFGPCTGEVSPAASDACVYGNDDLCTGQPIGSQRIAACLCGFTVPNPAASGLPNPTSYTKNADGTVTDNVTGLVWEGTVNATLLQLAGAVTYCASKGAGWSVPTRFQLISLLDYAAPSPGATIDPSAFPNAPANRFWASSLYMNNSQANWGADFQYGLVTHLGPLDTANVRCVRTGASSKCVAQGFQIKAGGQVYDQTTGLTWQQTLDGNTYDLSDAMAHCAGLGAGWRVPGSVELLSIVDDTTESPAIDSTAFPSTPSLGFWSSSVVGTVAHYIDFTDGLGGTDYVTNKHSVRCVH